MKHVAIALLVSAVAVLMACKGKLSPEQEAKAIFNDMVTVTEAATTGLTNAKDAKETAAALTTYGEGMKKLTDRAKEFEKNNPNYKLKDNPALKTEDEKLKKLMEGFMGAMMKAMLKYGQSPEVKEASKKMGEMFKQ